MNKHSSSSSNHKNSQSDEETFVFHFCSFSVVCAAVGATVILIYDLVSWYHHVLIYHT